MPAACATVPGAALGRHQLHRVVPHPVRRRVLAGQHQQLPDRRIVQRALNPLRHHLVVAHFHPLAVRLAHNAGNVGNLRWRCGSGCRVRLGMCPRCLGCWLRRRARRAVLGKLVAAQRARTGSHHQQQTSRHRRSLQAGKIVPHPLAQPFIPAPGRQRVQRFLQLQPGARHQVGVRLHYRIALRQAPSAPAFVPAPRGTPGTRPGAAPVRASARRPALRRPPSQSARVQCSQFIVTSFQPQKTSTLVR